MNEQDIKQQVMQLESTIKPLLTKEALTRYNTIKLAHPETAIRALLVIAQSKKTTVTDEELKSLLQQLQPARKQIRINR